MPVGHYEIGTLNVPIQRLWDRNEARQVLRSGQHSQPRWKVLSDLTPSGNRNIYHSDHRIDGGWSTSVNVNGPIVELSVSEPPSNIQMVLESTTV